MSSYKNASKSSQRTHRERSQPQARAHLGLLPKKKDYKDRAEQFHKKERTLKALKRKALDKNPDEFYFKMVRTKLKNGVHQTEDGPPAYTEEQIKLMHCQDIKYINFKRSTELKKIERLKASLHLLDVPDKPPNKHVVFVDTKKEAETFDAAKFLDTHPDLVDRVYNRPRMETLKSQTIHNTLDDETLAEIAAERGRRYKELAKRIEREKQLHIIAQKMEVKKQLMDKTSKKTKVAKETKDSAAVYKWVAQRKR